MSQRNNSIDACRHKKMLQVFSEHGIKIDKTRLNMCIMHTFSLDPWPQAEAVLSCSRRQVFLGASKNSLIRQIISFPAVKNIHLKSSVGSHQWLS